MTNPRLATRYAKSLVDLAKEQNQLETVYADMKTLQSINRGNADFVAMLRSPVIASDKKEKIIAAITEGKVSKLTNLFINLLTQKTREGNLPEIITAFITQYNEIHNIQTVKLTTAVPVSDQIKNEIVNKVKAGKDLKVELETKVDPSLIGGFMLEAGDTLVDASIQRDLNDVRKQFLSNVYLHNIR